MVYWQQELSKSMERVRETAKIEFNEYPITGGTRLNVNVAYGDIAAYNRMDEANEKLHKHRADMERFASDAKVYGSQGERLYDLDADDVHHFRLSGRPREE